MTKAAAPQTHGSRLQSSLVRRVGFKLLALALGLLLVCLLLEGAFRVLGMTPERVNPLRAFHREDPVTGYRGRPDLDERWRRPEFTVRVRHNAKGYRLQTHQTPRAEAEKGVYVFGDSFAWGWGVSQGETLTDRLTHLRPRWHVRNYGLSGSGTATQYRLFEADCRPELAAGDDVVLVVVGNDWADNLAPNQAHVVFENGTPSMGDCTAPPPSAAFEYWLKDHSYFFSWVMFQIEYRRQLRHQAQARTVQPGAPESAGAWAKRLAAMRYCLERFQADCRAAHARLVVFPVPAAAGSGPPGPLLAALEQLTRELGIDFVPARAAFAEAARRTPQTYAFDGHWTPAGHETAAKLLAEALSKP